MSLLFSDLKKRIVVSQPKGQNFGIVNKVFINLTQNKLISFLCKKNFYEEGLSFDFSSVNSCGEEVLFIDSEITVAKSKLKTYCVESHIIGRPVNSEDDKTIGVATNMSFNPKTFNATKIHLDNNICIELNKSSTIKINETHITVKDITKKDNQEAKSSTSSKAFSFSSIDTSFVNKISDTIEKFTKKLEGKSGDKDNPND